LTKAIFVKIIIVILFCFITIESINAQSINNKDFPVLSGAYKLEKEPVDYIIVVDQSGTVKQYWESIKASASKLVTLANDGDYLTVIGFKETVDNLILARKINSNSKRAIVDEIKGLAEPRGSYTDLFESVDFTLEKGINRPEGSKLQIIFYFTDFKNDPPPGSKWRTSSTDNLVRKRESYIDKTGKLVNIFAFQLPLEANAGRDFDKFSKIFDNRVKRIISDLNTLQEWFGRLSQEIAREKLKLLLKNDLNEILSIDDLSVSGDQIKIKVHNKLGFPVKIDQINLKNEGLGLNISQIFSNISVPKNGQVVMPFSISGFIQKHNSLIEKNIPIRNSQFTFQCSFNDTEGEFGILNIPTIQDQVILFEPVILFKTGIPYWIVVVTFVLLILIIYLIYKTWIKSEWTFNRKGFKVTVVLDGKLLTNSGRTFEKSKKAVIIEHTIINSSDVSPEMARIISESQFKIFVVPSKPRFLRGTPKRGTYLFAEGKGISFKVKKLVKSKVQFASIPANRRLFTERIFLHKGVTIVGEIVTGVNKSQFEFNFYIK
jgi:hypothetical protein